MGKPVPADALVLAMGRVGCLSFRDVTDAVLCVADRLAASSTARLGLSVCEGDSAAYCAGSAAIAGEQPAKAAVMDMAILGCRKVIMVAPIGKSWSIKAHIGYWIVRHIW